MNAPPFVQSLRTRLSGMELSRRERLLILALTLGASLVWAMSGLESAQSARTLAEDVRGRLQLEAGRQASLSSASFRRTIRDEAELARRWALVEPTVFMAQMRAQSQLEDFAVASGITNADVIMDEPSPPASGLQRLVMSVEGDFAWSNFLALLSFLEMAEASFVPVAVEVTNSTAQPRFSLVLEAAYLAPEGRR